jgi:hypothetical protein
MQNKFKVKTALFIPTAEAGGFSAHLVITSLRVVMSIRKLYTTSAALRALPPNRVHAKAAQGSDLTSFQMDWKNQVVTCPREQTSAQ